MLESWCPLYTKLRWSLLTTFSIHSAKNSCDICGTTWQVLQLSTKQLAASKSQHFNGRNISKGTAQKRTATFLQIKNSSMQNRSGSKGDLNN